MNNRNNTKQSAGEILIVDDDLANLQLLSEMLSAHNLEVRLVNNGTRALKAIKLSPPDLVLLDIMMPDISGYEVCRQLKSDINSEHVPVIFISGNTETFDKVQAFAVGGVDYVSKPFQVEEVIARVETQLKLSRMAQELKGQVLRYQLNPHFLFNALISVRVLAREDLPALEIMINQLSEYLRYLLIERDRAEITVREELAAANNYLAIEKLRFKDRLIIRMNIEPELEELLMPAFILQPLLENAIKYGLRTSNPRDLEVELTVKRKDNNLCLRVANSGYWVSQEDDLLRENSCGVGLQNIRQRLRQCYPNTHTFAIDQQDGFVIVDITIPVI